MAFTQDQHQLGIITNAGQDVLLLDSFSGQEGVSQPFEFHVSMFSDVVAGNPAKVKPHDLIGTSMTIRVSLSNPPDGSDAGYRYWSGFCDHFVQQDQDENFAYYSAVIVPWFSFMRYATNCRIFQDMDATQIIKQVVSDRGYSDKLTLELTKSYTKRDYCVQYNETDFAFISRLMEDEGIYYYFKHENGNHTMVLSDSVACYKDLPIKSSFRYAPITGSAPTEDTINSWHAAQTMHPGKWSSRDFHHESPTNTVDRSEQAQNSPPAASALEIYQPLNDAKFFNKAGSFGGVIPESNTTLKSRIQNVEASEATITGISTCREFTSGYKITVTGGDAAGSYLITSIAHYGNQLPNYRPQDQDRQGYGNSFHAIPASVAYVPTPGRTRGLIPGLQTAFVIDESPSGHTEEIWPDKFGRIRVRFHWDRDAKYACWVRVVQGWGGKSWGHQWIPRVGDEVAIMFLEGDPDTPVVIGSLYNADNMPAFTLPDNKTQSGILTRSSKGGGASNFNMLRFEDKIGSEEIYTQAEKDQNALIKNNETRTVKNNRTSTIHVNDTETVETGNWTLTVQQGNQSTTVKQNISTESQNGNVSLKVDQGTLTEFAQGQIEVTSPTGIKLTCGSSTITMTPAQITITQGGTTINLTAALAAHTAGMITLNS